MSQKPDPSERPENAAQTARQRRLAAALKANLQRRKAQARSRAVSVAGMSDGELLAAEPANQIPSSGHAEAGHAAAQTKL